MLELYNADAYQKINELLDKGIKVDHIITDPPYNISQDNNFHTMKNHRRGVDFGEWDRGAFDLYSWIPQYSKLLNANGSMIIFVRIGLLVILLKCLNLTWQIWL